MPPLESTHPPQSQAVATPSILTMSTFLTNIIDCVARPSTSDSPVRLLKSKYCLDHVSSPTCVSAISTESDNSLSRRSSNSLDGVATAVFPVSTAEPLDDLDDAPLSSIDNHVRQQFEAAFATFLYKNPAFTAMSHGNLTRLRAKLAKESARNARAESELWGQLEMLKENKRRTELELQRELLVVTRAKAAREAELRNMIWKVRLESMAMDEEVRRVKQSGDGEGNVVPPSPRTQGGMPMSYAQYDYASNPLFSLQLYPEITESESFQAELNRTRIEYERLNAEMERLKEMIQASEA